MEFVPIQDFPGYAVSIDGHIKNRYTNRVMALTRNNHGIVQVGMMRDGQQCKRSVALLVAKTFLDPPHPETFDTPIHLDGDQLNNRLDNLMWRPRWFAVKYHQQFAEHEEKGPWIPHPIIDVHTKKKYKDSWKVATQFGLLDKDIFLAVASRTYVWPTYQEFFVLD